MKKDNETMVKKEREIKNIVCEDLLRAANEANIEIDDYGKIAVVVVATIVIIMTNIVSLLLVFLLFLVFFNFECLNHMLLFFFNDISCPNSYK